MMSSKHSLTHSLATCLILLLHPPRPIIERVNKVLARKREKKKCATQLISLVPSWWLGIANGERMGGYFPR